MKIFIAEETHCWNRVLGKVFLALKAGLVIGVGVMVLHKMLNSLIKSFDIYFL